jgi:hypothetical protein
MVEDLIPSPNEDVDLHVAKDVEDPLVLFRRHRDLAEAHGRGSVRIRVVCMLYDPSPEKRNYITWSNARVNLEIPLSEGAEEKALALVSGLRTVFDAVAEHGWDAVLACLPTKAA